MFILTLSFVEINSSCIICYRHYHSKTPFVTLLYAILIFQALPSYFITSFNLCCSDKILQDEVPVVTYRILAYLLLGNVRIYSKKVEYLFNDCRDALSKINQFASNKKCNPRIGVMLAPDSSIVVPERFELDTFDLELIETENG